MKSWPSANNDYPPTNTLVTLRLDSTSSSFGSYGKY